MSSGGWQDDVLGISAALGSFVLLGAYGTTQRNNSNRSARYQYHDSEVMCHHRHVWLTYVSIWWHWSRRRTDQARSSAAYQC